MAWKVKPSGSMSIPRRDEPWVTEKLAAHIRSELMPRYAEPMGALMPSLHAVQEQWGWISHQAMQELAEAL